MLLRLLQPSIHATSNTQQQQSKGLCPRRRSKQLQGLKPVPSVSGAALASQQKSAVQAGGSPFIQNQQPSQWQQLAQSKNSRLQKGEGPPLLCCSDVQSWGDSLLVRQKCETFRSELSRLWVNQGCILVSPRGSWNAPALYSIPLLLQSSIHAFILSGPLCNSISSLISPGQNACAVG